MHRIGCICDYKRETFKRIIFKELFCCVGIDVFICMKNVRQNFRDGRLMNPRPVTFECNHAVQDAV